MHAIFLHVKGSSYRKELYSNLKYFNFLFRDAELHNPQGEMLHILIYNVVFASFLTVNILLFNNIKCRESLQ